MAARTRGRLCVASHTSKGGADIAPSTAQSSVISMSAGNPTFSIDVGIERTLAAAPTPEVEAEEDEMTMSRPTLCCCPTAEAPAASTVPSIPKVLVGAVASRLARWRVAVADVAATRRCWSAAPAPSAPSAAPPSRAADDSAPRKAEADEDEEEEDAEDAPIANHRLKKRVAMRPRCLPSVSALYTSNRRVRM